MVDFTLINYIMVFFNIILLIICFFAWREVWGLQGGYGKGRWSNEEGGYLNYAKDRRLHSTILVIYFTSLNIALLL